jgi:glycosyltransferase involved in cell wall biosynthesis
LKEAVQSCFAQTYRNFEIIIGDDSSDDRTQTFSLELEARYPGRIRYFRNKPSLGQNGNVNALFFRAVGRRLVLLHDDDLLLPNAVMDLSECWSKYPDLAAAFGRQQVISMDGKLLAQETERRSKSLNCTTDRVGLLKYPVEAGLLQMFPPDGFMILTGVARKLGYRSFDAVGDACDYDFSLRLCLSETKIFFHFGFMSSYRYTNSSISMSSVTSPIVHRLLASVSVPNECTRALKWAKQHAAWSACPDYARLGKWREALVIISSSDYTHCKRMHPRFLFHLALILGAFVAGKDGAIRIEEFIRAFIGMFFKRKRSMISSEIS